MSNYFVGDIHGCYDELQSLLRKVCFNPNKDVLWITGDLVFRGSKSLDVLRYIRSLGSSIRLVLGNHDIFFIASYLGIVNHKFNKDSHLFLSHDIVDLINWMRYQPLMQIDNSKKIIMIHAGIHPEWDIYTAIQFSELINIILSSSIYDVFLDFIYNRHYCNSLLGTLNLKELNFVLNVFTKMRYCLSDGTLDMFCKLNPLHAPSNLSPWFLKLKMIPKEYKIIFGHWSSLTGFRVPSGIIPLDTGCCWGGYLTVFRLEDNKFFKQKSFF